MNGREQLAHDHGLKTFAHLMNISQPLPATRGETSQCYLARHPDGHWFVWRDGAVNGATVGESATSR